MLRLLILDDDQTFSPWLTDLSEQIDLKLTRVSSAFEAIEKINAIDPDAALIDLDHDPKHCHDLVARLKEASSRTEFLVASSSDDITQAIDSMKQGAGDYLVKPLSMGRLGSFLEKISEQVALRRTNSQSQGDGLAFRDGYKLIGSSESMKQIFKLIHKLSRVDTTVLIRGESGTGKELVARALHHNSDRRKEPFVAVNCSAIPENLIESELFGFEKGTFTGANRKRVGKFQHAEGGTIFLDEIGDISPQMQVKILRVIQERTITPVGSNREIPINVRIVSATHRPLEKLMSNGSFRTDLYYRLGVMPISLPPLSKRTDDIPELTQSMIKKFNRVHKRQIEGIEPEALDALLKYKWPGNIRELENVIEHAFILESSDRINIDALPPMIQSNSEPISQASADPDGAAVDQEVLKNNFRLPVTSNGELLYPELKKQFEVEFIKEALKTYRGRINQTAEQTQMTKVTLLRKLEKYGINPKDFQH